MSNTYCIPVMPETLDLLEVLNSGVRPNMEEDGTQSFYVYSGKDAHSKIINADQHAARFNEHPQNTYVRVIIQK